MSEDVDLEALFDEVSSKALPAMAGGPEEAPAASAEPAESNPAADTPAPEANADKPMYERLGGIVRLLHDSMRELGYDRSLTDVASQINDAQGRLEHVATLTEQAANKVLNTIDKSLPAQDALAAKAQDINSRWDKLFSGALSVEEFKTLAHDSKSFSQAVLESTETEKSRMLEIMMAQDFQDLTGQLIKKIVNITTVAESELAQLLRDNAPEEVKKQIETVELLNGPSAPGAALEQGAVDDLLDSLGF